MHPSMTPTNINWYPPNDEFQYPPQATSHMARSKQWIEEKKEEMRQILKRRNIPRNLWKYYIETPKDWDYDDIDESGVHNGVRNILMSQRSVRPWWIKNSSMNKLVELKLKFTAVVQAIEEIDRFTSEEMPEDNQLASEYKQAQKQANMLQATLQTACNELSAVTVIPDESFGDEFYDYISEFVEETRDNKKARSKVSDMKSRACPLEELLPAKQIFHQTK